MLFHVTITESSFPTLWEITVSDDYSSYQLLDTFIVSHAEAAGLNDAKRCVFARAIDSTLKFISLTTGMVSTLDIRTVKS